MFIWFDAIAGGYHPRAGKGTLMRRALHLTLAAALGLMTVLSAIPSARADGYRDEWRGHDRGHDDWRAHEWQREHRYRSPYLYEPPPVVFVPQRRYYAPPPTYYAPAPGYYGY